MCHQKLLRGEFHRAPVLAGAATPREPCAAELRVALRGCAAALCRKLGAAGRAEVARLKWHQRFGRRVFARFLAPLSAGLVFFLRSRTHLRTLQLWFVSLPGKGLGACLVDRITGRSGWMTGSLAVQASTLACLAGPWNSCKT